MAKGDNTGIAQLGQQLNPNAFNQFGNPNGMPGMRGFANPSIVGPSPDIIQALLAGMRGMGGVPGENSSLVKGVKNKVQNKMNKVQTIQQGIQRLKGNQQQKPQSAIMPPKAQPMDGGGMFMLPEQRKQPQPQAMSNNMGSSFSLSDPAILQQIMGNGGRFGRNFM